MLGMEKSSPIAIWPNPTPDMVRIDGLSGSVATSVELIDASGRVVRRVGNLPVTNTVDVRDLPDGTYTIRIRMEDRLLSATFIKR